MYWVISQDRFLTNLDIGSSAGVLGIPPVGTRVPPQDVHRLGYFDNNETQS